MTDIRDARIIALENEINDLCRCQGIVERYPSAGAAAAPSPSPVFNNLLTENDLRQRTAQFETLLSEAPLGIYLIDADFRIRHVNPKTMPVFGDIPDLIGRDFAEVMHILWP